jgi:putative ABC transport system ATP-binding protein
VSTALIELNDVHRDYRSGDEVVRALDGVSLRIDAGEHVAIMGASGSGKSTLMNVLGALDRPTAGSYRLDGQEVSKLSDAALSAVRNRKIGFVFQSFHLLPRLDALENVAVPLTYARVPQRERRERAREALASLGLADRAHHLPSQLSGGQQQRVAIARALVTKPHLLLADEPTGALDTDTTRQILELLDGLHGQGLTLIVVTHEADVGAHADRILRIRDGRVVFDGPPGAVA